MMACYAMFMIILHHTSSQTIIWQKPIEQMVMHSLVMHGYLYTMHVSPIAGATMVFRHCVGPTSSVIS